MVFSTIEEALKSVRLRRPVIIVDSPDRENEGDLFVAAEMILPRHLGIMSRECGGNLCVPIAPERLDDLGLGLMVPAAYSDPSICRFTLPVDYKVGITSGVSYSDKFRTIKALSDPNAKLSDFRIPGHVYPLRAESGGVLVRQGHTEAAVDLARLAGLYPAGVICEVLDQEGNAADREHLEDFARFRGYDLISVEDLVAYRRAR